MSRIYLVTLGCDKNRVDGETMLGMLAGEGFQIVDAPEIADAIVVNTCGFIMDAVKESVELIFDLHQVKLAHGCKALVVVGCMAERFMDELKVELPEADVILGVGANEQLVKILRILTGHQSAPTGDAQPFPRLAARASAEKPHIAYVKIAEGCDTNCTYCTIPFIRGPYRSRPMEEISDECKSLVALGAKELVLVAQDTALYGMDLYGKRMLPELLRELSTCGAKWLRLMYVYPEHITVKLISTIAELDNVCKYIDMPLQHCEGRILRAMGRGGGRYELERLIGALRESIPGLSLRTTLMVGFPGETDEDFDSLCDFVKAQRFERMGVFQYSQEEGTPASLMSPQADEKVKRSRYRRVMRLQQKIHFEKQKALVGQVIEVIVDDFLPDESLYVGRPYFDAPETDGAVYFTSEENLGIGDFCHVVVTKASGYDLEGRRHESP